MRRTNIIGLIAVVLTLTCSLQTWAGETRYKNLSIKVYNPNTAKGRVYLRPYFDDDTTYCYISEDPRKALVKGNFTNDGDAFKVKMFVLPAEGYVLDCLTTTNGILNDNPRSDYIGHESGNPISTIPLTIDDDTTTNCSDKRPIKVQDALNCASSLEYYSVFKRATKAVVHCESPGSIAKAVQACPHGENVNDLKVTGPLAGSDLKYLNKLSQEKGLIWLDLSNSSFSEVPDSAFLNSGLYELKLPSRLKRVGNRAFSGSKGLKPVQLGHVDEKGVNTIIGCWLMNLMGVKEEYVKDTELNIPFFL